VRDRSGFGRVLVTPRSGFSLAVRGRVADMAGPSSEWIRAGWTSMGAVLNHAG
jgi:hypothetical protein